MKSKYYDGTKLLSLTDLNGKKPEIYMVTTNRTGGKTVFFTRLCVNKYKQSGSKFAVLYRYNYELDDCAENIFKDVGELFFAGDVMTSKKKSQGIYHELYINDVHCGYAISMNSADQIKKKSHLFSDVDRILMDEFQSETNHYCTDEITKFQSIHTSIARGQGEQVRYVPVYMLSNPVSIINPYYVKMGISARLTDSVKFLRGDGFILEQGYNESASEAQRSSAFNRAFAKDSYVEYASQGVYLNDNKAFVDKPKGKSQYIATLKYKDVSYGIREYAEDGVIYCDTRFDSTFRNKITVTTDDHDINYVMLKKNDLVLTNLRWYFEKGVFRFKDLQCKEAVLSALSY